jgi:hypothetical protein
VSVLELGRKVYMLSKIYVQVVERNKCGDIESIKTWLMNEVLEWVIDRRKEEALEIYWRLVFLYWSNHIQSSYSTTRVFLPSKGFIFK